MKNKLKKLWNSLKEGLKKLKPKKSQAVFAIYATLGLAWSPFFIASWLLRLVARMLLAISYFGMLDFIMANEVFKSLFRKYD